MGYLKHNAIVVTCWQTDHVKEAHEKAKEIFGEYHSLVSPIINGIANSQTSFFIAPDGSKEGWDPSDQCNKYRSAFCDWLRDHKDNYADYVEVEFGGDYNMATIERDKDGDLENLDPYNQ